MSRKRKKHRRGYTVDDVARGLVQAILNPFDEDGDIAHPQRILTTIGVRAMHLLHPEKSEGELMVQCVTARLSILRARANGTSEEDEAKQIREEFTGRSVAEVMSAIDGYFPLKVEELSEDD